jgi:glycine cleavage system H lipoate-binding protein
MTAIPTDLRYSEDHLWVRQGDGVVRMGSPTTPKTHWATWST